MSDQTPPPHPPVPPVPVLPASPAPDAAGAAPPEQHPPPPLPVAQYAYPYPEPPPMAGMTFPSTITPARPGILTAIGVISVIVGSLGTLAGLWSVGSLFAFSRMVTVANVLARAGPGGGPAGAGASPAAVPATAPVGQGGPEVAVDEAGMDEVARRRVAEALSEVLFLSPPRLEQLDVLLAKSGRDIFPGLSAGATPDAIGNLVQGHGTSPSAGPNSAGPDYFRTRAGRVELYDDRAVFYPARGAEVVRVSTLTMSNPGLTPEQVQEVVDQAQAASGNTMNASQVAALKNLLGTPGQQHVSRLTVPTAVRGATPMRDGSVAVTFPNGFATFGPQGQVSSGTGAGGMPFGRARLNGAALALCNFAAVVGLGLAVYLLVIGIWVLRQSPRGRKLHLIYAVVKIPVAILGIAATWWLVSSLMDSPLVGAGPNAFPIENMATSLAIQATVLGVAGLIYPIALLIALQSKAVKDYYESGAV